MGKNIKTPKIPEISSADVADALRGKVVEEQEVDRPIIFDGRQYAVRVPKRFADAVGLKAKDTFRFVLKRTPDKKGFILGGSLVKDGKEAV